MSELEVDKCLLLIRDVPKGHKGRIVMNEYARILLFHVESAVSCRICLYLVHEYYSSVLRMNSEGM